jgi:carbonic anhydrase
MSRRTLIAGLGGLGLGFGLAGPGSADEPPPASAEQALEQLRTGNARFVDGKTRHAHESADWRKQLVATQKPFATILGCSDSRVPVELVFDQGFGDLFVIRVAGNVMAPDVVGSVEYAVGHLGTPLVVVLGHQGCGAVTAALEAMERPTKELPAVEALVNLIKPGLPAPLPPGKPEERLRAAVEANVRWSLKQLVKVPEAKKLIDAKKGILVGAVYELSTGKVRLLDR